MWYTAIIPAPSRRPICGYGGIGRHDGFRFHWATVQVQVLLPAPNQYNPNLFPIGEGFGLFIFFERYEKIYFPNGVNRKLTSVVSTFFRQFSLQSLE